MPKDLLDDGEIQDLANALGLPKAQVAQHVPHVNAGVEREWGFIGWMLERLRIDDGWGIDVTLLGRDQAKESGVKYSAMGYSRQGIPCISPVLSNRGAAVGVALAIIATSVESPG